MSPSIFATVYLYLCMFARQDHSWKSTFDILPISHISETPVHSLSAQHHHSLIYIYIESIILFLHTHTLQKHTLVFIFHPYLLRQRFNIFCSSYLLIIYVYIYKYIHRSSFVSWLRRKRLTNLKDWNPHYLIFCFHSPRQQG